MPTNKDISILLQVAFKEWSAHNGKLPITEDDWDEIKTCAKNLWKYGELAKQEIDDAIDYAKRPSNEQKFIDDLNNTK